eukprot:jgi/Botrbrau1/1392/Bobra.0063s0092.1
MALSMARAACPLALLVVLLSTSTALKTEVIISWGVSLSNGLVPESLVDGVTAGFGSRCETHRTVVFARLSTELRQKP